MLCQETPATSLTPTALIVQGYTRGGGGGEVPDSHIHFSGVFLFVWGFLGVFLYANEHISTKKPQHSPKHTPAFHAYFYIHARFLQPFTRTQVPINLLKYPVPLAFYYTRTNKSERTHRHLQLLYSCRHTGQIPGSHTTPPHTEHTDPSRFPGHTSPAPKPPKHTHTPHIHAHRTGVHAHPQTHTRAHRPGNTNPSPPYG